MPSSIYKFVPLVEESHVDRNNKVVTTYTRNVGLSTFMTATEKVRYEPNPDNPDETITIKDDINGTSNFHTCLCLVT